MAYMYAYLLMHFLLYSINFEWFILVVNPFLPIVVGIVFPEYWLYYTSFHLGYLTITLRSVYFYILFLTFTSFPIIVYSPLISLFSILFHPFLSLFLYVEIIN